MGNKYIFAGEIRPALEAGESTIQVPEGAKLSPQAADLIRDYGAEVVFGTPAPAEPDPPPQEAAPPKQADETEELREAVVEEVSGEVSDDDVERILERVLERLSQATGRTYEPAPDAGPGPSLEAEPRTDDDLIICRCEEITKGQIRAAIAAGMGTLNGVKRVTRAGMGLCQGQTCQRLVTQILCQELKLSPDLVEPTTARPPTRPIPLNMLATG